MTCIYSNIALIGDIYGIERMLKYVPQEKVKCIVAASVRPQYLNDIQKLADKLKISFLVQPKFKSSDYAAFLNSFKSKQIGLLLCDSYSMILREDFLESIKYNAVNIHFSLLPKNRGCNPVQWSIIKGEKETGVSIHYIDNGMDTGDIIAQRSAAIELNDTWVTLNQKLLHSAEGLLSEQIPLILSGKNTRAKQQENAASVNSRLNAESPRILFDRMSDENIYNLIRAQVNPLKGAYIPNNSEKIFFDRLLSMSEIKQLRTHYAKNSSHPST